MSLPVTVVAELELDSIKPPPDKNEEEKSYKGNGLIREPSHVKLTKSVE